MPSDKLPKGPKEEWSKRNDTLRREGEKRPRDDDAQLETPSDYSATGGPEDERSYGRTRSDSGYYPRNAQGGPHDRDTIEQKGRGGYVKPRQRNPKP